MTDLWGMSKAAAEARAAAEAQAKVEAESKIAADAKAKAEKVAAEKAAADAKVVILSNMRHCVCVYGATPGNGKRYIGNPSSEYFQVEWETDLLGFATKQASVHPV